MQQWSPNRQGQRPKRNLAGYQLRRNVSVGVCDFSTLATGRCIRANAYHPADAGFGGSVDDLVSDVVKLLIVEMNVAVEKFHA